MMGRVGVEPWVNAAWVIRTLEVVVHVRRDSSRLQLGRSFVCLVIMAKRGRKLCFAEIRMCRYKRLAEHFKWMISIRFVG